MDKIFSVIPELIKNPLLAIVGFGLFLVMVGALAQWPGSEGGKMEPGWRIALAITGGIFAVPGMIRLLRQSARTRRAPHNIEGKYVVEGTNYEVIFRHFGENLYRANHSAWEGIGLYDGEFYYGIYRYKAGSDLPNNWGVHKAKLRLIDGALEFLIVELSNKCILVGDEDKDFQDNRIKGGKYTWVKADAQ